VTGWQREYQRAEDELDDPRSLALADWDALTRLAAALIDRSIDRRINSRAGVTSSPSRPAQPPVLARYPASAAQISTRAPGSGQSVVRPPLARAA
jgi:hypothetical protein